MPSNRVKDLASGPHEPRQGLPQQARAGMLALASLCSRIVRAPVEMPLPTDDRKEGTKPFALDSASFPHYGTIPSRHTCDGRDISPQLSWSGVPANARSLALIVDDPDAPDPAAPMMTWVHWILYNLPPVADELDEGVESADLPGGTLLGMNDWKRVGYGGPCPPVGQHRYFHKLYALDIMLPDLQQPTKSALEKAMQGHILDRAELVGHYQRKSSVP